MLKLTTLEDTDEDEESQGMLTPEVILLRLEKSHDRTKLIHSAKDTGVKKVLVFADAITAMTLIRQVSQC